MNSELVELARRLIRLKAWKWPAGSQGLRDAPGLKDDQNPEIRVRSRLDAEYAVGWGSLPDLSDPATLGLVWSLYESTCDNHVAVCSVLGQYGMGSPEVLRLILAALEREEA